MNKPQSGLPAFPRPVPPIPDLTPDEKAAWSICEAHRRRVMETTLLPFWQGMGEVYATILADNGADNESDGLTLTCTVEDWPDSFDAQQCALVRLIDESKLRLAWRNLARQMAHPTVEEQTATDALEKEFADSARPLREIPLGWNDVRFTCQQVICMPVSQWDAMFSEEVNYQPMSIDESVVEKLATRIARALNDPFPPKPQRAIDPTLPWAGGTFSVAPKRICVWNSTTARLIGSIGNHAMDDRLFDNDLRPIEHEPDRIPTWRFYGFYGQLRVTGIGDEPWYVTVLAPANFVGNLLGIVRDCE